MSKPRSDRPGRLAVAAAVVALAALVVVALAAAKPLSRGVHAAPAVRTAAAAHSCLVMTGSGDPAFVKNFNPFTATGLPSGQFVRGAIYEGLTIGWQWSICLFSLTIDQSEHI